MTSQQSSATSEPLAIVVFGRDEAGRPHASAFAESDVRLAEKAAELMGMRVLSINTEAERALAARVPRGKIFGSGKAFTPFIKAPLYDELEHATPGDAASEPKRAKGRAAKANNAAAASKVQSEPVDLTTSSPLQPERWDDIAVGAIVLAAAAPRHAEWFECQVTAVEGGDLLTLRYCDWPNEAPFARHRTEVGLVHPSRELEPPLEAEPQPAAA